MPRKPRHPCASPGCPALIEHGRHCQQHKFTRQQPRDSTKRLYGGRWRKARAAYLASNPLCKSCENQGHITPAIVVDHITPHGGDVALFWDQNNWQPMCIECHNRKSARELADQQRQA